MALLGRRRRKRRADKAQNAIDDAYNREIRRQQELQREQMQRNVFQTAEGQGIMEGANISLGPSFDEEEEDDLLNAMTGLLI